MSEFIELATYIGEQVQKSNNDYGNSFVKVSEILKVLYPDGVSLEQYHDFAVQVRVLDKQCRIANGNKGNENAWNDIAGYGILMGDKSIKK